MKKIIFIICLIIVTLVSVFVVSPIVSSPDFHSKTINTLDEKKTKVMELSLATVSASTVLASIPGDSTTPLANQILRLSGYLILVIGAIFLEKILLTLTGYVTFTFLIPISCILLGIYVYAKNEQLKNLAIKVALFGIIIFTVVPISVKVSNIIENTYQVSINQTIEETKNSETLIEENKTEDAQKNEGWGGFTSKVKDTISSIGDNVSKAIENGKKLLNKFIDAIAVLIITSCVIPIVILLSFIWIIKIVFSINITLPSSKKIGINNNTKKDE